MTVKDQLTNGIAQCVETLYGVVPSPKQIQLQTTRKEFAGDYTLVVFPFTPLSKKKPEDTATEMGEYLLQALPLVADFNVIKGFLNLSITTDFWTSFVQEQQDQSQFGYQALAADVNPVMIEFSSPNTNKPLHLGHIRNILLGDSLARIVEAAGTPVLRVNLVNDRGIHICKSMLAWKKWGEGKTPSDLGKKGDHLVGDFYVKFDVEYRKEVAGLIEQGVDAEEAKKQAPSLLEAQEMLRQWEQGEPEVIELWSRMNSWVYEGFDETYEKLGIRFDKIYYESNTYQLGKKWVLQGLENNQLVQDDDGSIWADFTAEGLDRKILMRSDGTSVYMTQDIGTAVQRFEEYPIQQHIYVVGNEQNYHFQVLKLVLAKLGFDFSDRIFHLSYGMVELPEGKMKSREGKVVDADDLYLEMIQTAAESAAASVKLADMEADELNEVVRKIALAALKYFILKVDPKKTMVFSPSESIDFNGNTGPFIQYTYARTASILRSAREQQVDFQQPAETSFEPNEAELLISKTLYEFPELIQEAAQNLSPALVANYIYQLAKEFNRFYHEYPILKAESGAAKTFRLQLCSLTNIVIKNGMALLGIPVPEKM